eukprot:1088695-Lingulodinium_polyedra.AAC.1
MFGRGPGDGRRWSGDGRTMVGRWPGNGRATVSVKNQVLYTLAESRNIYLPQGSPACAYDQ